MHYNGACILGQILITRKNSLILLTSRVSTYFRQFGPVFADSNAMIATMNPNLYQTKVLDNMATAILLFEEDMRLVYLNPSAEVLLGHSAQKVRGTLADELFPHAPKVLESLRRG